jgi:N-formylglutamate deformylase
MSKISQSFSITPPDANAKAAPLIFDSPHSGTNYPDDFDHACRTPEQIKALHDCRDHYVDELFAAAPRHGGTLLRAHIPRSYIDLNRAYNDIDPALFDGGWPEELSAYTPQPSAKSHGGVGLIRRIIRSGLPVYDRNVPPEEIVARIREYHEPYHGQLRSLIEGAHYTFGQIWHINCHSMPNRTASPKKPGIENSPSDFVLGNRSGTTCSSDFIQSLRECISEMGYRVTLNDPFQGVELIRAYSAPTRGIHSLQMEINKALYMDEATGEKSERFDALQNDIETIIKFCANYARDHLDIALAAD